MPVVSTLPLSIDNGSCICVLADQESGVAAHIRQGDLRWPGNGYCPEKLPLDEGAKEVYFVCR